MKRVLNNLKAQAFWKRFLWQFPLMLVLFSVGNFFFKEDGKAFSLDNIYYSASIAFLMAFYFSFRSHPDAIEKNDRLEALEELKTRKWNYYIGLYFFLVLLFFAALTATIVIGVLIFFFFVKTHEDFWSLTWKAYAVAAIMCLILVFISFVSDRLELNRLKTSNQ